MNAAIEICGLTKKYKDMTAVDHLSLAVPQGELFFLLGVNGAGKTTTIKMLSCLARPTSGDALLLGDSIVSSPEEVKKKINVSPQETAVARNLSVRENLEFIAGIYGFSSAEARSRAEEMIERFDLCDVRGKRAKALSPVTARLSCLSFGG